MKILSKYLDISYEAQDDCNTIEVHVAGRVAGRFGAQHGGNRMLCLQLQEDLVGQDVDVSVTGDGRVEVGRVASRRDHGDFLGLEPNTNAITACKDKASSMKRTVQWFATWKCNYNCHYCWQETVKSSYRTQSPLKTPPSAWVDAFFDLQPESVYITGGEPTLVPGMVDIVAEVGTFSEVNMTSNLGRTFILEEWFSKVQPDSIKCVTFSFHPTQVSWDEFQQKLERFCDHYGPEKTGVELVLHDDQEGYLEPVVDLSRRLNLQTVHLDEYCQQPVKYPLQPSKDPACSPAVRNRLIDLRPQDDQSRTPRYCPAGMTRFNIDPVGDVYACMSAIDRSKMFGKHTLPHYSPLGNIFTGFKPRKDPLLCWETFRCSRCDADHISKAWQPHGHKYKLPIPE